MEPGYLTLVFGLISMLCIILVNASDYCWVFFRLSSGLPPGPRRLLFVGNVLQIPMEYQSRTFGEWGQKYGDIIYIKLFHTPAIVLNSVKVAQDLLAKRSSKYSDRPSLLFMKKILGWDPATPFMCYGDRWRKHRKWIQTAYGERTSLVGHRTLLKRECMVLVQNLMVSPEMFLIHLRRFPASLVMTSLYGQPIQSMEDEHFGMAEFAIHVTAKAGESAGSLIDFFPFLQYVPDWLPGAASLGEARQVRQSTRRLFDDPYNIIKRQVDNNEEVCDCLIAALYRESVRNGSLADDEDDIKGVGASVYSAGVDTTSIVLSTFILAMVLHPRVYVKARDEIEHIVGINNLPTLEHRGSLPYVNCIIQELYRWNPPLPLGLPHHLQSRDEYRDFHIPEGSMVFANIWQMSRSAEFYRDAESFRPERFEDLDANVDVLSDSRNYVFGFGRRICPGRYFAEDAIWSAITHIIAIFDIEKAYNADGGEITPAVHFRPGLTSPPAEFRCKIYPRSSELASLMLAGHLHE
ncbi:hypothetical protein POSPLADRAFT_1152453 [Postia placenta MAD-698-R-SB12]|uniref:Cytochrome P450 n=2 Tax=Rhodonia placenta TaxID=104341 RepID=A0A1X6MQH9_9APHY|nr:hypothetical protein POSPLADRAFT_1152453 [Postia placenta MAD-698-R-SB12]OSX58539.1 hypothetical protein POSPLADRAFT_1152453 [Postia placenta MAD-698-R-SB12]BAK09479.1 cytochrome P450 [Postia placenta]